MNRANSSTGPQPPQPSSPPGHSETSPAATATASASPPHVEEENEQSFYQFASWPPLPIPLSTRHENSAQLIEGDVAGNLTAEASTRASSSISAAAAAAALTAATAAATTTSAGVGHVGGSVDQQMDRTDISGFPVSYTTSEPRYGGSDSRPAEGASLERTGFGPEGHEVASFQGGATTTITGHNNNLGRASSEDRQRHLSDMSVASVCGDVHRGGGGHQGFSEGLMTGYLGEGSISDNSRELSLGRTWLRRERSSSRPREQVSLPEDVYGAARVPDYWHGMHALSSLASAYVYDDIWAGDGGLNAREDVTGLTTSATGGVAIGSQERGGGGEAVVETRLQRTCSAGAGGRSSTAMLPRSWSRGSDLAQEGAAGGQQRRRDRSPRAQAAEQDVTPPTWRWKNRDGGLGGSGGGGGSSGGAACGPDGEQSEEGQSQAPLRQGGRDDTVVAGVGGEASAATVVREHPRDVTSGGRTERRGVRRRRTSSLDDEVFDGTSSDRALRDEESVAGGGGDCFDRLETGERCSKRINSPSSANELAPLRSSDSATASIAREHDGNISGGSGGDRDDERRAAEVAAAVRSAAPVDEGISCFNTRSSDDVENDPYRMNWEFEASSSSAAGASLGEQEAGASLGEEETFFAEHALEPKPRSGWDREGFAEGADASAGRAVAQGIVVRRLAQGIGVPRWGQHTDIYGASRTTTAASYPGGVAHEAGRVSRPLAFHLERGKDAFSDDGGAGAVAAAATVAAATALSKEGAATMKEAGADAAGDADATADAHSTKFEWEVRPEAMAAYFTSVIGIVQPSVSPMASMERSPHPGTSIRSGQPAGVNIGYGTRGVVQAGAGSGASVSDDKQTGGPGIRTESAAASTSQSCSMSCVADPQIEGHPRREGGGGDEESSLGW